MKDLGYANGWMGVVPKIVKECKEKGHKRESKEIGRCLWQYTCHKCQYTYKVDSSE